MVASNDIKGRAQEIRDLIVDDRLADAMTRLMDFANQCSTNRDDQNDATLLKRSVMILSKKERDRELEFAAVERERTPLLRRALGLVDEIEARAILPIAS